MNFMCFICNQVGYCIAKDGKCPVVEETVEAKTPTQEFEDEKRENKFYPKNYN